MPDDSPGAFQELHWHPTPQLRWAPDGELQQRWRCYETHALEWRPVPAVAPISPDELHA